MYVNLAEIDLERHPECKDLPLVMDVAKRLLRRGAIPNVLEIEDLVQVGYLTLLACAKNYDPENGTSYASYCFRSLYHEMYAHIMANVNVVHIAKHANKLASQMKRGMKLEGKKLEHAKQAQAIRDMNRYGVDKAVYLARDERTRAVWMDEEDVTRASKKLTRQEREVIKLHYKDGASFAGIGRLTTLWGKEMSRERVRLMHRDAIRTLREELEVA